MRLPYNRAASRKGLSFMWVIINRCPTVVSLCKQESHVLYHDCETNEVVEDHEGKENEVAGV